MNIPKIRGKEKNVGIPWDCCPDGWKEIKLFTMGLFLNSMSSVLLEWPLYGKSIYESTVRVIECPGSLSLTVVLKVWSMVLCEFLSSFQEIWESKLFSILRHYLPCPLIFMLSIQKQCWVKQLTLQHRVRKWQQAVVNVFFIARDLH